MKRPWWQYALAALAALLALWLLVIGMAGPLIVAYLIYRLHMHSEPESPAMLDEGERRLIETVEDPKKELPSPALSLPEKTTEVEEADQD